MRRLILASALALSLPLLMAADRAEPPEPSAGQLEAAGLLVDALKIPVDLAATVVPLEMKRFKQANPGATEAVTADYEAAFRMAFDVKPLREFYARTYALHFSETELRQLVDIFRSPVMQKYTQEMPDIGESDHIMMTAAGLKIRIARNLATRALRDKGELP